MIKKHILCDHCRGSGAASDRDIHTCSGCGGSGVKLVKQQVLLTATRDGTGSSCAQRFSLGCSPKVRLHVTSVVAVAKLSPKSAHTAMEARSVPAILRVESLMLIPLFCRSSTTLPTIPSKFSLVCQKVTRSCSKAKATKVQTGRREM